MEFNRSTLNALLKKTLKFINLSNSRGLFAKIYLDRKATQFLLSSRRISQMSIFLFRIFFPKTTRFHYIYQNFDVYGFWLYMGHSILD